jgi:uncharacterized protein involved in type VI secretion and phage assembly
MSLADILDPSSEAEEQKGKIQGVVIAVVTDNKDPEKMGRVKVTFPWRGDEGQSHWARVATFMSGNDMGGFFLPEVHDEVLVAFDRGDMDHPYIIGSLWNGEDKPPETNDDGNNNIRKIKSRSGHEVIFNDDTSGAKIEINSSAGHKILLDDTSGGEKIEISDKTGGNKIVLDSSSNAINIESAMSLSIKSADVTVEGSASLTLKSSGNVTIQGAMVMIN